MIYFTFGFNGNGQRLKFCYFLKTADIVRQLTEGIFQLSIHLVGNISKHSGRSDIDEVMSIGTAGVYFSDAGRPRRYFSHIFLQAIMYSKISGKVVGGSAADDAHRFAYTISQQQIDGMVQSSVPSGSDNAIRVNLPQKIRQLRIFLFRPIGDQNCPIILTDFGYFIKSVFEPGMTGDRVVHENNLPSLHYCLSPLLSAASAGFSLNTPMRRSSLIV